MNGRTFRLLFLLDLIAEFNSKLSAALNDKLCNVIDDILFKRFDTDETQKLNNIRVVTLKFRS